MDYKIDMIDNPEHQNILNYIKIKYAALKKSMFYALIDMDGLDLLRSNILS
jgi:hypothetical protein